MRKQNTRQTAGKGEFRPTKKIPPATDTTATRGNIKSDTQSITPNWRVIAVYVALAVGVFS